MAFGDPAGQLGKLAGSLSPSSALPAPPPSAAGQEPESAHLYSTSTSPRLSGLSLPGKQLDYGAGPSGSGGYGSPTALLGYSPLAGGGGDHMPPASSSQSGAGGVVTKQEAFGLDSTAQQQQQQQQTAAAAAASLAEFNQATSKGHEILSQVFRINATIFSYLENQKY
jgi:hypothetical protein